MASKYQTKIIREYTKKGYKVLNVIRLSENGYPDLIALKDGKAIFIECKERNDTLKPLQKLRIDELKNLGFAILETGNAPERNYDETLVFDLTYGKKNEALTAIKQSTGAKESFEFPQWLKAYQSQAGAADFLLILGTNANPIN